MKKKVFILHFLLANFFSILLLILNSDKKYFKSNFATPFRNKKLKKCQPLNDTERSKLIGCRSRPAVNQITASVCLLPLVSSQTVILKKHINKNSVVYMEPSKENKFQNVKNDCGVIHFSPDMSSPCKDRMTIPRAKLANDWTSR